MAVHWIFVIALTISSQSHVQAQDSFPLLMPMVHPAQEESYLCTPVRLSDTQTFYVTGFTPNATAHTAHHMLVKRPALIFNTKIDFHVQEGF